MRGSGACGAVQVMVSIMAIASKFYYVGYHLMGSVLWWLLVLLAYAPPPLLTSVACGA